MAGDSVKSKKLAAKAARDAASTLRLQKSRSQPGAQAAKKAATKSREAVGRKVAAPPRRARRIARPSALTAPPSGSTRASAVASAVAAVLVDASADEVEQVLTVARENEDELDSSLWGAAPGRAHATAVSVLNLREQFSRRRALERESLSRAEAADLLGMSPQAVTDALEAHRIVGFKRGRQWVIPAWQFDADTEQGVVPELERLTGAFPGGIVALSAWALRPSPDLDGASPRTALAAGDVDRVLASAAALTSAGW
jgi:hypothetical protein